MLVGAGSVLAAAGAVAGILSLHEARRANDVVLGSDLRVAEHRVTTKSDVRQVWEHVEEGAEVLRADTAAIDLVLTNRGDQPALVTEIEVVVRHVDELRVCQGAGAVGITTEYDIRIPDDLAARSVRHPVLYSLDGKSTERVLLSVGPEGRSTPTAWPTIHTVDVLLKQDSGAVLTVPDLVLVQPWQGEAALAEVVSGTLTQGHWNRQCLAENVRTIEQAVQRSGTRSPELIDLYDRLRAAGAAGPVDGIWVAALDSGPAPESAVQDLRSRLNAQVALHPDGFAYHPGPFSGPEEADRWCHRHGLASDDLCRPRYLTPTAGG
ncbi:hypothetical protein GCM10023222_04810 [Saccharopolyspora cebuensis]